MNVDLNNTDSFAAAAMEGRHEFAEESSAREGGKFARIHQAEGFAPPTRENGASEAGAVAGGGWAAPVPSEEQEQEQEQDFTEGREGRKATEGDWAEAQARAEVCERFLELTGQTRTNTDAHGRPLTPALSPDGGEGEESFTGAGMLSAGDCRQHAGIFVNEGNARDGRQDSSGNGAAPKGMEDGKWKMEEQEQEQEQEQDLPAGRRRSQMSGNMAARALGRSASWFSAMVPRYLREGVAGLLPERRSTGRKVSREAEVVMECPELVEKIRAILLRSNRGRNAGSRAFAIRRFAESAECPAEIKRLIQERDAAGKGLLPPSVLRRIVVSEAEFAQFRSSKRAALDYFSCPGSAMWVTEEGEPLTPALSPKRGEGGAHAARAQGEQEHEQDQEQARRRFIRAGEVIEADDATINFCAVVPWEMGGCKCSERFGVKVARFQLLLSIDVGSRKILAYTYVARPKSSYRAEDVVTLMNAVTRAHGEPEYWRFERGTWESKLVKERARVGGSKLWTVFSPHAKPFVEGVFNKLWTLLSLERGQVGRWRGEMEEESGLLTACQQGHKDPRKYFCSLKEVLCALDRAVQSHNEAPVRSQRYGEWIPNERWARHQELQPNRRLAGSVEWLASPFVREWTVRGANIGGEVRLFDAASAGANFSAPFIFSAPWLSEFHGRKLRAYFDPTLGRCEAMLCLAEKFQGRAAGEVLGRAGLVDECASYARMVLEWGNDDRGAGVKAAARAQSALRREVRVLAQGQSTEIRDGVGGSVKVTRDGAGRWKMENGKARTDTDGHGPARADFTEGRKEEDGKGETAEAVNESKRERGTHLKVGVKERLFSERLAERREVSPLEFV